MTDDLQPETNEPEPDETKETTSASAEAAPPEAPEDAPEPTAEAAAEISAAEVQEPELAENAEEEDETEDEAEDETDAETDAETTPRPPAKLERLQKILAQAGVASRRRAEELIEQGRVQVNGKIVTELGTKADAGRDHIRVDGKLLHGAERLRYFVLNKPRGFVTTVKDPEGRPTVMQFFEKMRERLYPVGRLDYMSEGLLLVTNDGELANRLTKASSGVEKTYLVKVSGQPTEAELDILRGGVAIERGKPGSPQVRTSPARIRQVRQGDNPWYEVVLIEGRNRELRKMFEEVGHFVEKIRRVGYGPLVLDQEPGNLRELEPEELDALRKTAEGKARTPKAKDIRRRNILDAQLPTLAPRPSRPRPVKPAEEGSAATARPGEYRPKKSFGPSKGTDKPFRPARPTGEEYRPAAGRNSADRGPASRGPARGPARPDDRPRRSGPATFGTGRPSGRPTDRPASRPAWKKDDRPARPPARFAAGSAGEGRPAGARPFRAEPGTGRPYGDKPAGRTYGAKPAGKTYGAKPGGKTYGARPDANKPAWKKPASEGRPPYKRPAAPHREPPAAREDFVERKPSRLRIDAVEPDRPGMGRPSSDRPNQARPSSSRPSLSRPSSDRPKFERATSDRPRFDRPRSDSPSRSGGASTGRPSPGRSAAGRSGPARPARAEGSLSRPFTTSTGKPRAGGARPSSKPGKPAGRSYGAGSGSRTAGSGGSGSRPAGKTGWKPKPSFGGPSKPGGAKRTGPRPGGKRPGGTSGGKRRG
jgi:23S rRNA pseudouridine2605 synthase